MMDRLGQVIAMTEADVAIILEVAEATYQTTMSALSSAAGSWARATDVAYGRNPNPNYYRTWLASYASGHERYGVLIRDLNSVRPIGVFWGPSGAADPDVPNDAPLTNLDRNIFSTYGGSFERSHDAYAGGFLGPAPSLPLMDVFASGSSDSGPRIPGRFAGPSGPGTGYRKPGLLMLRAKGANGSYLIPVVMNHMAAVRGGKNQLGGGQIAQLKDLHVSQKFQGGGTRYGTYIRLDGEDVPIQELVITGDFNVDFLQNLTNGDYFEKQNREWLNFVTPTEQEGGSRTPPAMPAHPGPPPEALGLPHLPDPGPNFPDPPPRNNILPLTLRAGVTAFGTMLKKNTGPPPFTTVCFDNFFYGGAQLSQNVQMLAPGGGALRMRAWCTTCPPGSSNR